MAEYETLIFSHNWNGKTYCPYFTTIRLENKRYEVGKKFRCILKGNHIKDVQILSIRKIKLDQINEFIAYLDTGYSINETKDIMRKMYPKANWDKQIIYFMLLKTL